MRRAGRRGAVALGVALAVAAGPLNGCGSDGSGDSATTGDSTEATSAAPDPEAAEAAAGVCGVLVTFDDTVASEVNGASHQINVDTDPDVARDLLLEATDNIQAAVDSLPDDYAALGLTEDGAIGQLVTEAVATTDDLDEQLDTIRVRLTEELEGEGPREILSAVFIDMEKIQSLAQPEQGDLDDAALVEALDTTPDCEHTISR